MRGSTSGARRGLAIFEPLDGAQDRNRRRDHAVAIEQGGADHGQECHAGDLATLGRTRSESLGDDRQQGENSALAVVVGTHDEDQVLDRDHEDECPEHERQNSEQVGGNAGVLTSRGVQTLFQGVQRAGANVAEDHAERTENQCGQTRGVSCVMCAGVSTSRMGEFE